MSLFAGTAMLASAAMAQTQVPAETSQTGTESEGDRADIVVTARGREERLQDVPIQVNVIGAQQIKKQGLQDVLDLTRLAPSFNYQATQRGQGTISMRGLNPNSFNVFVQGVSFFVDGIYIPGEVTSLNLQDLERVEVLKGPQATQFGRGTYAGAVNYVTRTPSSNDITGRLDAELSSYGSHDVNGYISFPIVRDSLFGEVSARHYERGHRYFNRNDGLGVGDQRSINLAGILHWQPTSDTSIKLRYSHDHDDDANPASFTLLKQEVPLQTFPTGATYPVFRLDFRRPDMIGFGDFGFSGYGDPDGNRDRKRDVVALIASQRFSGGYEARYAGNYYSEETLFNQDVGNRWLGDPTLLNPRPAVFGSRQSFKATSQEIRLNSPAGERFTWTVGGNYYRIAYKQFSPGIVGFFPVIAYTPGRNQILGQFADREIAGFGSASFEFVKGLQLTAEGRYQSVRLSYDRCDNTQCQGVTGNFVRTENDFLPRVTLDYKPSDDVLLYTLFSKGVKNGRINTTGTAASEAAFNTFAANNYQKPESVDNFEAGFKASSLGGKLQVNGAAYLMKVKNQQVTTFLPSSGGLLLVTANGGASTIKGAELTIVANPSRRLELSGGVGYTHHRFTSASATNSVLTALFGLTDPRSSLRGRTSVLTPAWSGNASGEYTIPIADRSEIALRADYTYTGRQFIDVPNLIVLPAIQRIGVSARVTMAKTSLTVFAKNLFNDRDPQDAAIGSGNLTEQGSLRFFQTPSIVAYLPYGRTVGIRVSQRF